MHYKTQTQIQTFLQAECCIKITANIHCGPKNLSRLYISLWFLQTLTDFYNIGNILYFFHQFEWQKIIDFLINRFIEGKKIIIVKR